MTSKKTLMFLLVLSLSVYSRRAAGMSLQLPREAAPPKFRTVFPKTPPPMTEEHRVKKMSESSAAPRSLAYADDRWSPMTSAFGNYEEVSDATIRVLEKGVSKTWEVESPVTFKYRVSEEKDLWNFERSDALLFGHLDEEAQRADAERFLLTGKRRRLVFVDETVYRLHGDVVERYFKEAKESGALTSYEIVPLVCSEASKNLALLEHVVQKMSEFNVERKVEPVLAVGGGVCLDVVGLASSLYRRKTPYIRIPTTLLSYVDASVGAKTGVNFEGAKNRLGAYVPPAAAFLSTQFLGTEDRRATISGVAEIMKMALVKSPRLFHLLETNGAQFVQESFAERSPERDEILQLAISTMLEELAPNLWEHRLDRLVDFGHVFGIVLEMSVLDDQETDEDDPPVTHGESVAIDMAFSTVFSAHCGHITIEERDRILDAMRSCGLPTYHPRLDRPLIQEAITERLGHALKPRLPLPTKIGKANIFNDIDLDSLHDAYAVYKTLCENDKYPHFVPV